MDNAYPQSQTRAAHPRLLLPLLLYAVFVAYGSLVPFSYEPRSLEEAVSRFLEIRYLHLDVHSRADWIANLVLYVPLAFLGSAWVATRRMEPFGNLTRHSLVFLGCVGLALSIEFVQTYFHRTVSLNDLIAETLGTILGIALWARGRKPLIRLWNAFQGQGVRALQAAIAFYAIVYLGLVLFPYDFLISTQEIAWKLGTERYGLVFAGAYCEQAIRCAAKLIAEVLAFAPLGVLVAVSSTDEPRATYRRSIWIGLILGLGIESVQFFMASGVSQGISVLTRAAGMVLGVAAYRALGSGQLALVRPMVRPLVIAAVVLYLPLLTVLNGWFNAPWLSVGETLARFADVRWMPFYFHYFTTEPVALRSLVAHIGMYMPVGLAAWALRVTGPRADVPGGAGTAAAVAAVLASVMEFGKLFVPGKHPDTTDILIAAFAAWFIFKAASWIRERLTVGPVVPESAVAPKEALPPQPETPRPGRAEEPQTGPRTPAFAWVRFASVFLGMAALWGAATYPVIGPWLGLGLVVYAALLWRFPLLWLIAIPACLPVLDFAPLTGRFFLNEFDLLIITTLAVAYWRLRALPSDLPRLSRLEVALISIVTASYVVSGVKGLIPLSAFDLNAFSNYYSHYNSLRIAKGFFWALALLPLLRRALGQQPQTGALFVLGMCLGLLAESLAVLWQRNTFSGMLNLSQAFRVTGTFSAMHTGGAAIETYLAASLPFVLVWLLLRRNVVTASAGLLVLALGLYALLVTYARSGYLAFAASLAVVLVGFWASRNRDEFSRLRARQTALAVASVVVVAVIAVPLVQGAFISYRFGKTAQDFEARTQHWREVVQIMDRGLSVKLFGMGLGRFPETYFWGGRGARAPAMYRIETESDNRFLRLGAGDALYFGQWVRLSEDAQYTIALELRTATEGAKLSIPACQKSLLYSYRCKWLQVTAIPPDNGWHQYKLDFGSDGLVSGQWYARRPVEVALRNASEGTVIDVDNIRLLDASGGDLLRNGDFSAGTDHWFFTVDNHLPWHVENFWVGLYFEQGLFGALAVFTLLAYALASTARSAVRGNRIALALASSMCAFIAIGFLSSFLEFPRLTTLFYVVIFVGLLQSLSERFARTVDSRTGLGLSTRSAHPQQVQS